MNTKVETLEDGKVKLTVTIEAAEVNGRIKKTYKDFSHKYRFPGFRAGKAPRPVVDNMLGKDAVVSTVTDDIINETFPVAVDENNLFVIAAPKFGEIAAFVKEGEDFTYDVELTLKPEFELNNYEPAHIEIPVKEATEADVDAQVEALTEYYFDYKKSPANTKVKAEGTADLTMKVTDEDGKSIDAMNAEERMYTLGEGILPAAFDEELIGMKKGETKTITLDVAENPCMMFTALQDVKAKTVTIEVTVDAVKKKVYPEVTDEWVKEKLEIETVEELRNRLKEEIAAQKEQIIPALVEDRALAALQERLEGEVPASLVEEKERDLIQQFFTQLQRQGLTLDAYLAAQGLTPEQFKEDVKLQANDVTRQNLALDAYARHFEIVATDEEVYDEFVTSGAEDPKKLFEEWKAQGQLHIVREGITRGKALEEFVKVAELEENEDFGKASK